MYSNTSCTIFLQAEGYTKKNIPQCFLVPVNSSSYNKQGLIQTYTASCIFEYEEEINFTDGKDLLLEGTSSITVGGETEQEKSESLKTLINAKPLTVQRALLKKYGSRKMWHYELYLN